MYAHILSPSHTPPVTHAHPLHQGTHAEFSFTFENLLNTSASLPFAISHNRLSGEGIISISDPLDFETTDRYVFRVSTHNHSPLPPLSSLFPFPSLPLYIILIMSHNTYN